MGNSLLNHSKTFYLYILNFKKGEAVLEYDMKKDVLDMFHTEVPMGYQGINNNNKIM